MPSEHIPQWTDLDLSVAELLATLREAVSRAVESRTRSQQLRQDARDASARIAWLIEWY
jgi:hypothetical protein